MTDVTLRISIVDDDALVRRTIEAMLFDVERSTVSFALASEFLAACDTKTPDKPFSCLLLDLKLPDMSGLDVLRELDTRGIEIPTVMISGQGDISSAVRAMRDGATDFIEKPFTSEQLLGAIDRAIASAPAPNEVPPELARLSTREREVLELLVLGDANKIIAYKLGISQRTVEVHRARIMERMAVKSFADLVRKAISAGL